MFRKLRAVLIVVLPVLVINCAAKVARVESASAMDLSGRWNDTDSRLVSEQIVADVLSERWLTKWEAESKVPTVIIGRVVNSTHEHINVGTFTKDIERALLRSGRVSFVASRNEREQIREERTDMADHASVETRADMGEEHGADYMLMGTISAIVDQEGKRAVIFYQIDMELVELESNRKVWIGEKKIKKYVERASVKF